MSKPDLDAIGVAPRGGTSLRTFLSYLAIGAIAFTLVFNRYLPEMIGVAAYASALAASSALVGATFLLSALFKRLGYVLVCLLFGISALEKYIVSLGIKEPRNLVLDLLDSDWREVTGFIDVRMLGAAIALVLAGIATVRTLHRAMPLVLQDRMNCRSSPRKLVSAAVLLALVGTGLLLNKPAMEENRERQFQAFLWPYVPALQTMRVMKGYFFGEMQFAKKLDGVPSAATFPSILSSNEKGLVVVFVFGESVRADHWGLNNYERNTTPILGAEGGLVNFGDALSFGTYTQVSAIGMMTPATFRVPFPRAGSFIDLFKKHGFALSAFIASRQTSVQKRLIRGISNVVSRRGLAMELIPEIERSLHADEGGGESRFIYVYTEGNHFPYNRGYSSDFEIYRPADHGRSNLASEIDKIRNAYDNAIVYTDAFLGALIQSLRGKRAVLLYSADHGDALGEGGRFIRGGTMRDEGLRRVPFFIWMSSKYVDKHSEVARNIRSNSMLPVSHENIFPTILRLAGIDSVLVDGQLDLTSMHAVGRTHHASDGGPKNSPFHIER